MRNIIAAVLCGILLVGCSRSDFSPEMKGIGFWADPDGVRKMFVRKSFGGDVCFSSFIVQSGKGQWEDFCLNRKFSMAIPELMAQRVTEGFETLARKDDFTVVEWQNVDVENAKGFFEFDAFYGSGRVVFKAMKINGEWVIPYMAIPRKDKADDDDPYIIFNLSEDEAAKLMQ